MISTKKLINMAKKWQKYVATHKKRISFHSDNADGDRCTSSKACKGHLVVYSSDQHRFEIPIIFLKHEIIREVLEMSEKELGLLPNERPIVLPVDAQILDYLISMMRRGVTGDVHQALLSTVAISRCSISSLHREMRHGQSLVY